MHTDSTPADGALTEAVLKDNHPSNPNVTTQLKDIKKKLPLRVLSESDWQHWITQGYVIVRNAVPQENVDHLVKTLWEFQEMDPNDPSTWYKPQLRDHAMKELNNTGMVEMYNHQYLWDNRQHTRVHDAFVDIWDMEELWVAIDRANLNPPNREARATNGFIHWDVDTSKNPLPIGVQGVLSLQKQDGDVGGFQCIPKLFSDFDEWVKTQPADRNPKSPDLTGLEITNISMDPGDLLIFNSLLAHGIRPNRSENRVRMAQYISMFPADETNTHERDVRVSSWRDQESPKRVSMPGDPRGWEKNNSSVAQLTPLGEKLLGLKSWH
jgi:ectoine hydroxylase-related dioxygenase (phytanoyl-CoA dioxygenase family)